MTPSPFMPSSWPTGSSSREGFAINPTAAVISTSRTATDTDCASGRIWKPSQRASDFAVTRPVDRRPAAVFRDSRKQMTDTADPDLIKITEVFLVPSSFLVAALGTADTNPHRAGVSVLGLVISVFWLICAREALSEVVTAK